MTREDWDVLASAILAEILLYSLETNEVEVKEDQ